MLNFPDTVLGNIESTYTPADNEIVGSIEAGEMAGDGTTKSSVFISLKQKTPYDITPVTDGVQISFPKPATPPVDVIAQQIEIEKSTRPTVAPIAIPVARRLQDVQVAKAEDSVIVNLKADGEIKDYRSFTLNNPARIVVDLYNLKSFYKDEQKFAVESNMVNQVRYCAHPDKVRLVVDTNRVASYDLTPLEKGMQISLTDGKIAYKSPSEKAAKQLETVTVTAMQNHITVNIKADGPIEDYRSFTLDNPPRIVFDVFDIRSPYKHEQTKSSITTAFGHKSGHITNYFGRYPV